MFARKNRFSFKGGLPRNVFKTPYFVIRYKIEDVSGFKVAVVVGKKVDKRAVFRNNIKRKIVKEIRDLLDENKGSSMVIYAKKTINNLSDQELAKELRDAFSRINLI